MKPDIIVVNIKQSKDPAQIYIGRSMRTQKLKASPLANPFRLNDAKSREQCLSQYRNWLNGQLQINSPARAELGRLVELAKKSPLKLACWCAPETCHGDVIREKILEALEEEERLVGIGTLTVQALISAQQQIKDSERMPVGICCQPSLFMAIREMVGADFKVYAQAQQKEDVIFFYDADLLRKHLDAESDSA